MPKSKISHSLFPQFTEEQLEEVSKIFKSSVNWTSYKKWVEDGKSFEEYNELIGIQKLDNEFQKKPAGTEQSDVNSNKECQNRSSSHHSARKITQIIGKKGNKNTLSTRVKITICNKSEYCSKNSESDIISNTVTVYKPNASRPAEEWHLQ